MPWNDTARVEHKRDCARYPSDLTDREWGLIEEVSGLARVLALECVRPATIWRIRSVLSSP